MIKKMTRKQILSISSFFWEIAKIMVASGAVAGVMMANVQIWKVLLASVLAIWSAILGLIVDGTIKDETDKTPT